MGKNIKYRNLLFFCEQISELCKSFSGKSIPTFIKLLFGAMLTNSGHVTQALLAVDIKRHWTTYYNLGTLVSAKTLLRVFSQLLPSYVTFLTDSHGFDFLSQTFLNRFSRKADCLRVIQFFVLSGIKE